MLPLVKNSHVLEIGFGSGALLTALKKNGNQVYGVDAGNTIVAQAKAKGFHNIFHIDASEQELPFEENCFDVVYCYETFEHLTNPHRLFVEVRRTLKPGGRLYFSVPSQEKTMGYGPSRHSFVYPGLLEKKNLERFFMQMYFKVELFKEEGAGLIVHRHYILKNMKEDQQPDIMEVIVGDHSIGDLYSRVLEGDALQKEIVNELTAYIACLETCLSKGDDHSAGQLVNTLLTLYADYYLVYIQLAEALWKHGQAEPAGQILAACLSRCKMSTATRGKIHHLIERLSPINT